jgi:RNA polymerase sigma-70 factor (ECF subfamily)
MKQENPQQLNLISTLWSLVCQANAGPAEAAQSAREQLLERYGGAVHRYLRKLLHDADAADDVFQEFALELVHGRLRGADPQRGRFRNFVKGTLYHLVADYRKKRQQWPESLPPEEAAPVIQPDDFASDRLFLESWSDELLARTWAALATVQTETCQPYYDVLRFRADHPELRSPQLAEQLTTQLGRPMTAVGVRQTLHRAREKFADLLLGEVSDSLANPETDSLVQELIELGLLDYCHPALERRGWSV